MIQCPACSEHVAEGKFCDRCGFQFESGVPASGPAGAGRDLQKTMIVAAPGLPSSGTAPFAGGWNAPGHSAPGISPIGQGAPGLPPMVLPPPPVAPPMAPPMAPPVAPGAGGGLRQPVFVPMNPPAPPVGEASAPAIPSPSFPSPSFSSPSFPPSVSTPPSFPTSPSVPTPPALPTPAGTPAPSIGGGGFAARPVSPKTIIVTDDLLRQAGLAPLPSGTARLVPKRFGALTNLEIPLEGSVRVGRFDPTSGPVDIDLSQFPGAEHVSRHHATIENIAGGWQVTDAGSANGVYVKSNGQANFSTRITAPAELHDGDELAFGNVVMVFRNR